MSDYTEAANYMLLAAESNDSWMKDRALRRGADELTRLQSEVERLRGRCGEMEASCVTYESRLQDYEEYMERVPRMILRRQAEAIEELTNFKYVAFGTNGMAIDVLDISKEAQRLRQQADEAEKAGG